MNAQLSEFSKAVTAAVSSASLKALVLSKPNQCSNIKKTKFSLRANSDKILLVREDFLSDGKALQKLIPITSLEEALADGLENFGQANLLTSCGDAEYRLTKKGNAVLLGLDKLMHRLEAETAENGVKKAEIAPLHRKKNYILSGDEPFLVELGITDENRRIHDKQQPKFRQINRFLEYVSDILDKLPKDKLVVHDLCCGKSYLSFAVYHYLVNIMHYDVEMIGVDLKSDVIAYCNKTAADCGFDNLRFICGDIRTVDYPSKPDLVISLHACDVATDIVLEHAVKSGAKVILSTPCCQHELYSKLNCEALSFIAEYPVLKNKFCAVATDAMRLKRLESRGYSVKATELTDPDDTPKNVLLMAVKRNGFSPASPEALKLRSEYNALEKFLLGN